MKYLLKTVETYRVASDAEAKALIEEAKKDKNFILAKYQSEQKEKKVKGEVEDTWVRVTLTKTFTDEKEPEMTADVIYTVHAGAFPEPIDDDEEEEESLDFNE